MSLMLMFSFENLMQGARIQNIFNRLMLLSPLLPKICPASASPSNDQATCKAIFILVERSVILFLETEHDKKRSPIELFDPEHLVLAPGSHEEGIYVFHQPKVLPALQFKHCLIKCLYPFKNLICSDIPNLCSNTFKLLLYLAMFLWKFIRTSRCRIHITFRQCFSNISRQRRKYILNIQDLHQNTP